jgi:hypothetical protein
MESLWDTVAEALTPVFAAGFAVQQFLAADGIYPRLDVFVTALILSAGTEGFNSIMKFLGYAKEGKKAEAAGARSSATPEASRSLSRR